MNDLSEEDHDLMDGFLGRVFDEIRSETLERGAFVELIALVMTALDLGRREEALRFFRAKEGARLRIVK